MPFDKWFVLDTDFNVVYERDYRPAPFTIQLEGVTLEQALNQIMSANQLWYKVQDERTILVIPDNNQKRQQYEELVIRNFYISHADPQELPAGHAIAKGFSAAEQGEHRRVSPESFSIETPGTPHGYG